LEQAVSCRALKMWKYWLDFMDANYYIRYLFKLALRENRLQKRLITRLFFVALVGVAYQGVTAADEVRFPIVEALNAKDTAKAVELLKQEIELDKAYHMNYYMLGRIYFNQMHWSRAKEQFALALDKKSKHYESLYYLGLCYFKLDQVDSAQMVMDKGRKKADKNLRHLFENGYGLTMLQKGNYQEADKAFRQALVDDPDNTEYLINLGDANFYQGIPSLATTYYAKALEVDTGSTEVYYHWAEACIEMRDYNCAIEKLHIVLSRDSTYANAWMRAGGIYFKAALSTPTYNERVARFKDAIGSYKRYLELSQAKPDSSNVRVFFELAMSYVNLGGAGFEEAVKYFTDVLSIPMEPRDIYFYYAKALWGIQEYEKSGEMLKKHLQWVEQHGDQNHSKVSDAELYLLLGDSYFYRTPKDYAAAVQYYLKSLQADPDQKRVLYNVAFSYHTMKSYHQAIEYYDKRLALGIDSSTASILKNAGYCALNLAGATGDEEENIDDINVGENPGNEGTDLNTNYYQVAVDYLTKYLQYAPADTGVVLMVANTYLYQLSDCNNGVQYYQLLLKLDPGNCDAQKALGFAYFGGICPKNYTKALGYLNDAYRCISSGKGTCSDVNLILWIAQCYHLRAAAKAEAKEPASEDFQYANEWYQKCLKCSPSNADCKKGEADTRYEF
jgi:tetratricopeptide (TPR) repeat protein